LNYDAVTIPSQNIPAHLDIEKDIQEQKNGLFTFIIKVANGNIADYNVVEYVTINKYLRLKRIVITELTIKRTVEEQPLVPRNSQLGNRTDPVGTDNG
jgi:hypothetical protein